MTVMMFDSILSKLNFYKKKKKKKKKELYMIWYYYGPLK